MSESAPGRILKWLQRTLAVVAAVVLFLVALFAVNQEQIALKFLGWQTPALSVFWWLLVALLLGLGLGLAAATGMTASRSMHNRRLRKELRVANDELQRLREQVPPRSS